MTVDPEHGSAIKYRQLGHREKRAGRDTEARVYFEKARLLLEAQVATSPDDAKCHEDLASMYADLGRLALKLGELDTAASFFEKELGVGRTLISIQPSNGHCLTSALSHLGNVALERERFTDASNYYEQQLSACLSQAGDEPSAQEYYSISICYDSLARTASYAGAFDRAQALCERSIVMRSELAENHPSWERELAVTYDDLGLIAFRQGRFLDAWMFCEHAFLVVRSLLETATEWEESPEDPPEGSAQALYETSLLDHIWLLRDVPPICENLGKIAKAQGKTLAADDFLALPLALKRLRADVDEGKVKGLAECTAAAAMLKKAEDRWMVAPVVRRHAPAAAQPAKRHRVNFRETYLRLALRADALEYPTAADALRARAKGWE